MNNSENWTGILIGCLMGGALWAIVLGLDLVLL